MSPSVPVSERAVCCSSVTGTFVRMSMPRTSTLSAALSASVNVSKTAEPPAKVLLIAALSFAFSFRIRSFSSRFPANVLLVPLTLKSVLPVRVRSVSLMLPLKTQASTSVSPRPESNPEFWKVTLPVISRKAFPLNAPVYVRLPSSFFSAFLRKITCVVSFPFAGDIFIRSEEVP